MREDHLQCICWENTREDLLRCLLRFGNRFRFRLSSYFRIRLGRFGNICKKPPEFSAILKHIILSADPDRVLLNKIESTAAPISKGECQVDRSFGRLVVSNPDYDCITKCIIRIFIYRLSAKDTDGVMKTAVLSPLSTILNS